MSSLTHLLILSAVLVAGFTLVLSMVLLVRKVVVVIQKAGGARHAARYRKMITGPLLDDDPGAEGASRPWTMRHRETLDAVAAEVQGPGSWNRRAALYGVLVEMSRSLRGDPSARVGLLYERYGYVRRALGDLRSRKWWIRSRACRDLGTMRSRRALYALLDRLHDSSDDVRQEASIALVAIAGTAESLGAILHEVGEINPWFALRLSVAVNASAVDALEHLVDALFAPAASVRRFATIVLGEVKDHTTVPDLLQALDGAAAPLRMEILATLGRIGDARALPALSAGTVHADAGVRHAAMTALGELGAPPAAATLAGAVRSGPLQDRRVAAAALVRLIETSRLAAVSVVAEAGLEQTDVLQEALDDAGVTLPAIPAATRGAA